MSTFLALFALINSEASLFAAGGWQLDWPIVSGLGGFLVFFSSFEGSEGVRIRDIPSELSHSPAAGSGFASATATVVGDWR